MVTRAEAKIHRVGPRHTIYLAKDLVEDSTFPFRADEDLTVRIEGDALIIDKDGRSGRRPTKLDEAHSHREDIDEDSGRSQLFPSHFKSGEDQPDAERDS